MVWKITIPDLKINLIGLEKIKSYILKLLFLLYAFLLNSCETKSEKSLSDLSSAFYDWYQIEYPVSSKDISPYNFYLKSDKMNPNYEINYLADLKKFSLELSQIEKKKLNDKNNFIHNTIDRKINNLINRYGISNNHLNDPSLHYIKINKHLRAIIFSSSIDKNQKVNMLLTTLDILPDYLNLISKSILKSNNFLIDKSLSEIDKIIEFLDLIPLHFDFNDDLLISIENKVLKVNKYLTSSKKWLTNDISNTFDLDLEKYSKYFDNNIKFIEEVYSYPDLTSSLDIYIKTVQNQIFDLSLPIYLEDNDEPIWSDRDDTLYVIKNVQQNIFQTKEIEIDNSSKIISFNNIYNDVLFHLIEEKLISDKEIFEINFPNYEMNFNEDQAISLILENYGKEKKDLIFNNTGRHISNSEILYFITNELLPRNLFNNYNKQKLINYDYVNHYSWGILLSQVMIDLNPNIFNKKFQIFYKTKKLQDLTLLKSKIKYISNEFSFKKSIDYLQSESFFINDNNLEYYFRKKLFDVEFDLELFAASTYISTLYEKFCIIDKKVSNKTFLKKIFKNGFITPSNYKSILN